MQSRLPLPLEVLWKRSEQTYDKDPGQLLLLANSYKVNQDDNLAWHDLYGRLTAMHASLAQTILEGRRDEHGNDLTPYYRAAFGVLEDIMMIPAKVEERKLWVEENVLKLPEHLRGVEG